MSFLKNLKIVAAPSKQLVSPEQHRRNKCVVKLAEQIEIAEAGATFTACNKQARDLLKSLGKGRGRIFCSAIFATQMLHIYFYV